MRVPLVVAGNGEASEGKEPFGAMIPRAVMRTRRCAMKRLGALSAPRAQVVGFAELAGGARRGCWSDCTRAWASVGEATAFARVQPGHLHRAVPFKEACERPRGAQNGPARRR